MTIQTTETLQRLWNDFLHDQLENLPPGERQQ